MSDFVKRMGGLLRASHTSYMVLFIGLLMLALICKSQRWARNDVFVSDMGGYYMYLPSTFLLHDLGDASWVKAARKVSRPDVEFETEFVPLANGKTLFKFPMGMSVAYSPFFFLARTAYFLQGETVTTGYERAYQYMVALGCMGYVLLGIWVLGKELRRYFADHVVAITLLILAIGSNLYNYSTHESLMSHGTLFLMNTLLLRYTRRWYENGRWSDALILGATAGLMILIRPSELMLMGVPVLYGLTSWAAVAERVRVWLRRWQQCLLIAGIVMAIGAMQFVFWRVVGGQWVIPFYAGEDFHFTDPHVLLGWFSFQKGWLVYSPLLALALIGIIWVRRYAPAVLPLLLLLFPIFTYITFSWWTWQYGGSYGGRAMISIYPILSFGMAAFWQRFIGASNRLRPSTALLGALTLCLLVLSIVQNYQYSLGLINCCEMTWALYKDRFLMLSWQ